MSGKPAILTETVAQLLSKGDLKDDPRRPDYFPTLGEVRAQQERPECTRCHGHAFEKVVSADGYELLRCVSCELLRPV